MIIGLLENLSWDCSMEFSMLILSIFSDENTTLLFLTIMILPPNK